MPRYRKSIIQQTKSKQGAIMQNPEQQNNGLVAYKRKKQEINEIKKLKMVVQKQLKLLTKKDQIVLKKYLNTKNEVKEAKQKQKKFIKNLEYKQWLSECRLKQLQNKKIQTSRLKKLSQSHLDEAKSRLSLTKNKKANFVKTDLNKLKIQRAQSQSRLLFQNKTLFEKIQKQKQLAKQSNTNYFRTKRKQILKSYNEDMTKSQTQSVIDKLQIYEMENDLMNIKKKTQMKTTLINKLNNQIQNIKKQTYQISRSRLKLSSSNISRRSFEKDKKQSTVNRKSQTKSLKHRSSSLPSIYGKIYKIYHNQI